MGTVAESLDRLKQSRFRARFRLGPTELAYLRSRGMDAIREHARQFIAERLAPAEIGNDGKQTPYRGHPVFIAQHATATCCRSCMQKWHGFAKGRPLTTEEQAHAVELIVEWIRRQAGEVADKGEEPTLFG